jgi:hypothetical protein
MSEYQYYEFQSLGRPLSASAQAEMESLSSRVHLTANSASFVYNYGDFRGDPYKVLAKHFDVMLYIANWGTRRLMFRFPADAIPSAVREAYQYAESMDWSESGNYVILDIRQEEEDGFGWVEGEGLLRGIAQVQNDIMRGDYRSLYLAWLMVAVQELYVLEDDEDLTEPPVPPGLHNLSPTLRNFADFFEIDMDLVNAAAKDSERHSQPGAQPSGYLEHLPNDEKLDFLKRLLAGETHLDIALAKRLRELSGADDMPLPPTDQRRTIRQLMAQSEQVEQERLEKERRQAEVARKKHLEKIARVEDQYWASVPQLIEQKRANTYDEAIQILKDLHDLAEQRGQLSEFQARIRDIRETYPTLRGLHSRLDNAGLFQR